MPANSEEIIIAEIQSAYDRHDLASVGRLARLLRSIRKENPEHAKESNGLGDVLPNAETCEDIIRLNRKIDKLSHLPTVPEIKKDASWSKILDKTNEDIDLTLFQKNVDDSELTFYISLDIIAKDVPFNTMIAVAGELDATQKVFNRVIRYGTKSADDGYNKVRFGVGMRSPLPAIVAHRNVLSNVVFFRPASKADESNVDDIYTRAGYEVLNNTDKAWWRNSEVYFFGEGQEKSHGVLSHMPFFRDNKDVVQKDGELCECHCVQGVLTVPEITDKMGVMRRVPRLTMIASFDPKLEFNLKPWFLRLCINLLWTHFVKEFFKVCRAVANNDDRSVRRDILKIYRDAISENVLYKWIDVAIKARQK